MYYNTRFGSSGIVKKYLLLIFLTLVRKILVFCMYTDCNNDFNNSNYIVSLLYIFLQLLLLYLVSLKKRWITRNVRPIQIPLIISVSNHKPYFRRKPFRIFSRIILLVWEKVEKKITSAKEQYNLISESSYEISKQNISETSRIAPFFASIVRFICLRLTLDSYIRNPIYYPCKSGENETFGVFPEMHIRPKRLVVVHVP